MSGQELTVAAAFARIKGHEELCALRYEGIMTQLKWIIGAMGGMVISLLAWMAVQLYTLEPLRISQSQSHNGQTTIVMPNQTGAPK